MLYVEKRQGRLSPPPSLVPHVGQWWLQDRGWVLLLVLLAYGGSASSARCPSHRPRVELPGLARLPKGVEKGSSCSELGERDVRGGLLPFLQSGLKTLVWKGP